MSSNELRKGRHTTYGKRIGLYGEGGSHAGFLQDDNSVVLSFPFKDCVLEGGMTKEDKKREERYLHQAMDRRDINTLFEPKVLTGFEFVGDPNSQQPTANSQQPTANSQQPTL
ncbi:hypothetical protein [Formicincola oecophyllae]|uniref:hypothetical protein n=1 Tax=Formicincola oecophyllae TaxID=2558361 RepID=UPI0019D28769|nr:hypothetical protein [Formicincola oecophyllae]